MGLFDLYGYPVCPQDMRALSGDEIQKMQYANLAAMQNSKYANPYQKLALVNFLSSMNALHPVEQPSLDKRFADFKVRLATAIEKRKMFHQ